MDTEKITFKNIKKQMTDERVLRNKMRGITDRVLERCAVLEAKSSGVKNSSSHDLHLERLQLEEEMSDEIEKDDLLLIIRGDNTSELLVDGQFVVNPKELTSPVESESSASGERDASVESVESGGSSGSSSGGSSSGSSSSSLSDSLKGAVGGQPIVQKSFNFFSKLPPACFLPNEYYEKLEAHSKLSLQSFSFQRLEAGDNKQPNKSDNESSHKNLSEQESSSSTSSSDDSSKKSCSSTYSESKDILIQKVLQHGEVGPKRLTKDYDNQVLPRRLTKDPPPTQRMIFMQKTSKLIIPHTEKSEKDKKKKFTTYVNTKSYVAKGAPMDKHSNFQYHLSKEERRLFTIAKNPMKDVPEKARQLLKEGQRQQYLNVRNEQGPVSKYHYPEATSWRYGWLIDQTKNRSSSSSNAAKDS